MKIKKISLFIIPAFLLGQNAFSLVDTQLQKISNTFDYPSPGHATLVIDVLAVSASPVDIIAFQDAFQLDAALRGQYENITFSDQLFEASNYDKSENYTSLDGEVEYTYTYASGAYGSIGTSWIRIVRVSIEYLMAAENSTVGWFDGPPDYQVYDIDGDQTGSEQSIPLDLTDFSLPVQMTEIQAKASAKDGITLRWTTESELNNVGFHVWRSEAEDKPYKRISNVLIPGHGNSSSQNTYSFSDRDIQVGKTYWYKIEAVSAGGKSEFLGPISAQGAVPVPDRFALSQNYPNPFNPATAAGYELPEDSKVLIRIYTMLGKQVKTLVEKPEQAGRYSVSWDGTDSQGLLVPSGIYFMQMQAGNFSSVRKMTLIR
jgi:hypothetical protein